MAFLIMDNVRDIQISLLNTQDLQVTNSTLKLINCQNLLWLHPQVKSSNTPILMVDGDKTTRINIVGLNGNKEKVKTTDVIVKGAVTIN